MDIKKFQLFADVAETENFTKSGDRMGYTQSGVSHMLKSLEDEVNFPLFVRSKQGVKLTPCAEAILPSVRALLSMYENLEQNINEINGLETGQITIATFSSISIHWLPEIIHAFLETYPGINIRLMEGGTDDIVSWVESDIADFGFLSNRHIKSLDWITLYEDPLVAVLPNDYPVPKDNLIPISSFDQNYFILSAMGTDYDVHHVLETSNITPIIRFTSKDDHAIISMVENHLGISILPELITQNIDAQISTYRLDPYFCRTLGVVTKSQEHLSPAANKFLTLTRNMIGQLQ